MRGDEHLAQPHVLARAPTQRGGVNLSEKGPAFDRLGAKLVQHGCLQLFAGDDALVHENGAQTRSVGLHIGSPANSGRESRRKGRVSYEMMAASSDLFRL